VVDILRSKGCYRLFCFDIRLVIIILEINTAGRSVIILEIDARSVNFPIYLFLLKIFLEFVLALELVRVEVVSKLGRSSCGMQLGLGYLWISWFPYF
jgi:hypothetical protein